MIEFHQVVVQKVKKGEGEKSKIMTVSGLQENRKSLESTGEQLVEMQGGANRELLGEERQLVNWIIYEWNKAGGFWQATSKVLE